MLQNQTFIDPQIASRIYELQKQMKSLVQQKLQIQYNSQFMDVKRREQLLRSNEEQRLQLRKIIQKCKFSMVEYLDKQVKVLSIDCVKNGSVVRKSKEKFQISKVINSNRIKSRTNNPTTQQYLQQEQEKQYQECKDSRHSQSTNYKSKVYPNDKSFNCMNLSGQQGYVAQNMSGELNQKQRKSCLSTHCRTSSREYNKQKQYKGSKNIKQKYTSPTELIMNGSSIQNKCNSSQVMQINEFNITSNSIPNQNQKSSLLAYLNQQYLIQQSQDQITQLYTKKISCLEKKCQSLQTRNGELLKVIEYQENTIMEIGEIIRQKDLEIEGIQRKFKEMEANYREKMCQVYSDMGEVLQVIEKYKSTLCMTVRTNQIIYKYKQAQLTPNHIPLTFKPSNFSSQQHKSFQFLYPNQPHYQRSSFHSYIASQHHQQNNSQAQQQKNQLTQLSRQLVELQIKLKQIQEENQLLKGERKLLLKKIKIS